MKYMAITITGEDMEGGGKAVGMGEDMKDTMVTEKVEEITTPTTGKG